MSAGNVGKKKNSGEETSFPTNADFRKINILTPKKVTNYKFQKFKVKKLKFSLIFLLKIFPLKVFRY